MTLVLLGTLMFTSWNIEAYNYQFNVTQNAYQPILVSNNYPYLVGINMIFFSIALILGMFDLFNKYGSKFAGTSPNETGRDIGQQ